MTCQMYSSIFDLDMDCRILSSTVFLRCDFKSFEFCIAFGVDFSILVMVSHIIGSLPGRL